MIELMVVVAIIGVLGVLAAPAYQSYTSRGQVAEGLSLADGWKEAILEYYNANGAWPSQTDLAGTSPSVGKYETGVTVNVGVIQITYGGAQANPNIEGAVLTIVPYTNDSDEVFWQCGLAATPAGSLPSGAVAGGTTLSSQFLPAACHT
jgi:type IV pilus assembly protein PilA